jgi:serine/threonine protein phosphatase PrpC
MTIETKSATHVGMVRELNEDSFVENPAAGLWAVADGMGGHEAGEVASKAVVDSLAGMLPAGNFDEALHRAQFNLSNANAELVQQSVNYPRDRVPGTTVVALLIHGDKGAVIWAGDSRIYRKRGPVFEQLSRDHSHVQDLVDRHLIREDEAESHPMANVITRAVGIEDPMEFDTRIIDLQENDQFVLCSDGLSRLVTNDEMDHILENHSDDEIVQSLLHTALVRGAPDNVTLIYVNFLGPEYDADNAPTLDLDGDDLPFDKPGWENSD